jgi:hypothetical protein
VYKGYGDPSELNYGLIFTPEALENYAIEKGFFKPDVDYADDEWRYLALSEGLSEACYHLAENFAFKRRYSSVHFGVPKVPANLVLLTFYSNYTPEKARYPEDIERKVVEALRKELKLPPQARPKWYHRYD